MENFRLRVFRAVAEELSFRKAAEVLHLSQPAVSQHVRALEEEAGVQLFDRARGAGHGSQISLTEAGRVLLRYANAAAETMVEARRSLAALHEEADGPLKLGASTTVAQYLLPRILGAFLKQYPQVKLSLVSGNTEQIVEAVAEKKVALGIIEGPAMRREVKTERMVEDEMVLIVCPNHAWARKGGAIEKKELAKVPLLLRERGSGSRRVVERALKEMGLPLRSLQVAMELDSTEAIISGVEAELGVGFVSLWALGKALRLGTVKVVAVKGLEMRRDFSFVRLAGAEMTGAAAAFQRFALGAADGQ
ncbi:LysR substrate-binding domain-containing protein [Tunturibacter empetritectus]|uniref:DNA-binding transcriptional LysR family regulator n=1 Tax=Tunturiibacter lichenicola TaxID=2051959 RepID=A0A7W8N267_9BACT|nr:LysR substrate-binding domain-containing protein [Edaphobacter lichenicola]MBB5342093.1 DNA-binding transcriptional LysR family regulator [Edaphobacter lichenicola]